MDNTNMVADGYYKKQDAINIGDAKICFKEYVANSKFATHSKERMRFKNLYAHISILGRRELREFICNASNCSGPGNKAECIYNELFMGSHKKTTCRQLTFGILEKVK